MDLQSLNESVKHLWTATSALIFLVIGAIISGLLSIAIGASAFVLALLFLALGAFYGSKRYSNWGFEVRDDHLYIEHGVLKKTYSMVPFVRVQHIDTDRGPVDRLLGLSTLRVYTAGSKGADIKIPGIEREKASELQKKLRDSAISSEKGFDAV
jgi:membrane protein YdbS with pleckstrin-like domain